LAGCAANLINAVSGAVLFVFRTRSKWPVRCRLDSDYYALLTEKSLRLLIFTTKRVRGSVQKRPQAVFGKTTSASVIVNMFV
jgi:hypothetical protein